jgi:hypothetical protein
MTPLNVAVAEDDGQTKVLRPPQGLPTITAADVEPVQEETEDA